MLKSKDVIGNMADKEKSTVKKSKLPLLIILLIILCAAGGGGYFYWQNMYKNSASGTGKEKKPESAPVFMPLETFTVNLGSTDRVLYIGITLRLSDEETRAKLNSYLPEVRSRLLLLFSRQDSDELATEDGKQQLIGAIKKVLAEPLVKGESPQIVIDVLYNTFILR